VFEMAQGGWGVCIVLENFKYYLNSSAGTNANAKTQNKNPGASSSAKKKKTETGGE